MMSLQEAIEEMKSLNAPITADDFTEEWEDVFAKAIATILNAVIQGDLVVVKGELVGPDDVDLAEFAYIDTMQREIENDR